MASRGEGQNNPEKEAGEIKQAVEVYAGIKESSEAKQLALTRGNLCKPRRIEEDDLSLAEQHTERSRVLDDARTSMESIRTVIEKLGSPASKAKIEEAWNKTMENMGLDPEFKPEIPIARFLRKGEIEDLADPLAQVEAARNRQDLTKIRTSSYGRYAAACKAYSETALAIALGEYNTEDSPRTKAMGSEVFRQTVNLGATEIIEDDLTHAVQERMQQKAKGFLLAERIENDKEEAKRSKIGKDTTNWYYLSQTDNVMPSGM